MEIIFNPLQINSGDTLLVSGSSFLSYEIQDFEKCKWSHAAMFFRLDVVTTIQGRTFQTGLYVVEMIRQGFCITAFQDYINDNTVQLLILKPKFSVDPVAYWNFVKPDLFRQGYGFFNLLVAQPIKYLTNYRIWLGDVSDNNPKRFICGEKVEYIYNHFNPDLFVNWKSSAPSDIFASDLFTQFQYSRTLIN